MTDVPRRAEPSGADKVAVIADRAAPGSLAGNTQWHRPQSAKQPTVQNPFGEVTVGDTTGQDHAVAITLTTGSGDGSTATGGSSVAVGHTATATGEQSIAIGGDQSGTVVGPQATEVQTIAIGTAAVASGDWSVAIGSGAIGIDLSAAAVGNNANANGAGNVALGSGSEAIGSWGATAVGAAAKAYGGGALALGKFATVGSAADPLHDAVAIGFNATATRPLQIALGTSDHTTLIAGRLVIFDPAGAMHQIVVDSGGVLSTVPYV